MERRSDVITESLAFPQFLVAVPTKKLVPGEETYALEHVGTQFATRSWGKPLSAFYWPKSNTWQIVNGHHRWAEALARHLPELMAWVSVGDEEKGFGALTEEKFKRKRMEA